ncbi:DUF423 domain-containing protein [Roseibium limicola]|uniref:DUF423 domain-containing protein n=1 Tax=Roseibium limicola TaxID=2816037 RepID=A0A939J898_9HYPH|nr:DUF423 domain-containing protein [Roseibium limicola]MBO0344649.1 DUF423 domain-containing protein [Roseibium limicola]
MPLIPTSTPSHPTVFLLRAGLFLGGISGMGGVMLMAAAAHVDTTGLMNQAGEMLMFHAPALAAMGLLAQLRRAPIAALALTVMSIGLALFCGDLVMRAMADHRLFPMAAPSGGMALIISWALFALAGLFCRQRS